MIGEHVTFALTAVSLSTISLLLSYYNSTIKSTNIIKTLLLLGLTHSLADGYSTYVSERSIHDKITNALYDSSVIVFIYGFIHIMFIIPFLIFSKKTSIMINYIIVSLLW